MQLINLIVGLGKNWKWFSDPEEKKSGSIKFLMKEISRLVCHYKHKIYGAI